MNEVAKDVENALEGLPIDSITAAIGQALLASNVKRIHQEGKDTKGSKIGSYNASNPVYVNPKTAVRKRGVGQPGTFKNGNKKKTVKFNSYKAYRGAVGRETNFVNLNLTGKLQADFDLVASGNKAQLGFFTDYGSDISQGMERKYAKEIWGVTKEDERDIVLIVEDIVADYIKRKI